jgi:hypothetical protein
MLGISEALHPDIFEQPALNNSLNNLFVPNGGSTKRIRQKILKSNFRSSDTSFGRGSRTVQTSQERRETPTRGPGPWGSGKSNRQGCRTSPERRMRDGQHIKEDKSIWVFEFRTTSPR